MLRPNKCYNLAKGSKTDYKAKFSKTGAKIEQHAAKSNKTNATSSKPFVKSTRTNAKM